MWVLRGQPPALFQFLGRNSGRSDLPARGSTARRRMGFNSSVGILVVRTYIAKGNACYNQKSFNSSVGILVVRTQQIETESGKSLLVSIPRSEFWSFGHTSLTCIARWSACFNSSVGILVVRTIEEGLVARRPEARFNSSVGILVVRTDVLDPTQQRVWRVSIPRSEFWSFGP